MRVLSMLVLLLCLTISSTVSAQEAPKEKTGTIEKKEDGSKTEEPKKDKAKGGVIDLGKFKVDGKVRKPEAFYILQRSTLNLPETDKKKSFLGNIVESVDKNKEL